MKFQGDFKISFISSKCLLIISGEWDMDYIDPMSWMNWKYIELIRIIQ